MLDVLRGEYESLSLLRKRDARVREIVPISLKTIERLARQPELAMAKDQPKGFPFLRGVVNRLAAEESETAVETAFILRRIIRLCAARIVEQQIGEMKQCLEEMRERRKDGSWVVLEQALEPFFQHGPSVVRRLRQDFMTGSINSITSPARIIAGSPGFTDSFSRHCKLILAALETLSVTGSACVAGFSDARESAIVLRRMPAPSR